MHEMRSAQTPSLAVKAGEGSRTRALARLGAVLGDWSLALPLIAVAGTVLLIPCFAMVLSSFSAADGSLTLKNWIDTFSSNSAVSAITGSLLLGFTVATIAAAIGIPLSLIIARMPGLARLAGLGILGRHVDDRRPRREGDRHTPPPHRRVSLHRSPVRLDVAAHLVGHMGPAHGGVVMIHCHPYPHAARCR